jgi:predicted AlkP superfamily pyrophosphatase or phosphodiesterase
MRYEMLDRYRSDFGPDGFNLLVDEGMRYDSCTFSYIPTFTAPGHATIYTGVVPSKHGILGNDIYIPQSGKERYCIDDDFVKPLGTSAENCKRSPRNLKAYTIGDSLKMADEKSKVIALSIKDRGAILPGGKKADAAYWMDDNGTMVSSDYYMKELPLWVDSFNMNGYIFNNVLANWDYFQGSDQYEESLPDDSPFESKRFDDAHVLPYNISQAMRTHGLGILRETPFGNSLLNEFAIWALREEKLGWDKHTDLLSISYSSTDLIGHAYGPQSVEVQDAFLRLDRDLAYLIHVLDTEIGRKNYVLFLTSDHGVANTPADSRFSYVQTSDLKQALNDFTKRTFGVALIKHIASQQIWLDEQLLINGGFDRKEAIASIHQYMLDNTDFSFEAVYTKDQIAICKTGDCLQFRNAFIPALSGHLYYIRKYGEIERSKTYGTTHGTGYLYDTHVPLLFFGGNVDKGSSKKPVSVSDIRSLLKDYLPEW